MGYFYQRNIVTHLYLGCLMVGMILFAEGEHGSTLASPGFQPHLMTTIQLYQTSSSAVVAQALQILLWCPNMWKCRYEKLMPWYGFSLKKKSLMEDKRMYKAQRVHTRWNSKRHTSLVSLLLWQKWWSRTASFGLYACDCGQWGSEMKFFSRFF